MSGNVEQNAVGKAPPSTRPATVLDPPLALAPAPARAIPPPQREPAQPVLLARGPTAPVATSPGGSVPKKAPPSLPSITACDRLRGRSSDGGARRQGRDMGGQRYERKTLLSAWKNGCKPRVRFVQVGAPNRGAALDRLCARENQELSADQCVRESLAPDDDYVDDAMCAQMRSQGLKVNQEALALSA